jgi:hypothetical protein
MSAAEVDRGWQLSSPCTSALQLPLYDALRTSSPSSVGQDAELGQTSSDLCVLANPLPLFPSLT